MTFELFDKSGTTTSSGTTGSGVGSSSGAGSSYLTRGPLFISMQLETTNRRQMIITLKLIFDAILEVCLCVLINRLSN